MQDNPITPVSTPTPRAPSTHVHRPKLRLRLDELFPPFPSRRRWLAGLAVILIGIGAIGVFLWLRSTSSPTGDGNQPAGIPAQTTEGETTTDAYAPPATTYESEEETSDATEPEDETGEDTATEHTAAPDETVTYPPADSSPEDTSAPTDTPWEETTPPIPEGCLAFASVDMSGSELGVGYIQNEGAFLPSALPTGSPWGSTSPTVLIVNTHPYEGYGGESPWYDPATGELALTDSPNDPGGVVALGTELAKVLRSHGVTVIHLRLSVTKEESTASIYTRTEEAIRYYRRLYPDIGLVVDLRRSAELTAEGDILATKGDYNGDPCAQLRITVNGGRDKEALSSDVAVALAIREELWNGSPTLSRPIRIKDGMGLGGDLTDLRVLTLEIGSAGNTYEEAHATMEPLGASISKIIKKYS